MLIDSHCHLHDREFFTEAEAEAELARARERGVEKIICIGTSHEDSLSAREFALTHKNVYWTYGIHPESAGRDTAIATLDGLRDGLVAIGEVGLDYHYDGYNRDAQIRLLEEMLALAVKNNLPLSFHVREAFDDFLAVVKNFPEIRGVVHSFSDSKKNLHRVLDETPFLIGVNGMATYSTLPTPPLERIVLETDAPFLAPVPHRGETNTPAFIPDIAIWLSAKLGATWAEVAETTTKNAEDLFNLV